MAKGYALEQCNLHVLKYCVFALENPDFLISKDIGQEITTSLNSIPVEWGSKRRWNLLARSSSSSSRSGGAADNLHAGAGEGVVVVGRVARAALYPEGEECFDLGKSITSRPFNWGIQLCLHKLRWSMLFQVTWHGMHRRWIWLIHNGRFWTLN